MICGNCKNLLNGDEHFCPYCGYPVMRQPVQVQQKDRKKVRKGRILAGCILGVLICGIGIVGYSFFLAPNKPEIKRKNAVEQFVEYVNNGKYEKAEDMLELTEYVGGSFENFAKEYLKNCRVEQSDGKYILIGDNGKFRLNCDEDTNLISSDDFTMEYRVKYTSYISSSNNTFTGYESEELENGMTLYTNKVYKTPEISFQFDAILGESNDLVSQFELRAKTDGDFKICEITEAVDYLDSSYEYEGAYLEEDGTIVLDLYYISEAYSETIAETFSEYAEDMTNAALAGESFENFYSRYDENMFDTDVVREEYEGYYSNRDTLNLYFNEIDASSDSWEYPQELYYSDDSYVLEDDISMTAYKGDSVAETSTDTYYVMFKPGRERLKVYAYAKDRDELYEYETE